MTTATTATQEQCPARPDRTTTNDVQPPVRTDGPPGRADLGLLRNRLLDPILDLSTAAPGDGAERATPLIVVGPPGMGKTTLLHQAAARWRDDGQSVAWYTVPGFGLAADEVVQSLGEVLARAVTAEPGPVRALHRLVGLVTGDDRPLTLVIDDAHRLAGPGTEVVTRLVDLLPAHVRLVVAGRREEPGWARLRLSGPVLRIDATDLRFRVSEVRQWHEEHLAHTPEPDEAAELTRRSEGWIAGIRMFHLSTVDWSAVQRRHALTGRWDRLPLIRQYLTANVLSELPVQAQDLLVLTSVLPLLTGAECDALLGRSDSELLLADLAERNAFVTVVDPCAGTYRCHPLFRRMLESELTHRLSADERRAHQRRAGELLERAGRRDEALRSYLRAGDMWSGTRLALRQPPTNEPTPPDGKVWSALRRAHRELSDGRVAAAVDWYARASAEADDDREHLRTAHHLVAAWLPRSPVGAAATHWSGQLRAAVRANPVPVARVAAGRPGDGWVFTAALAALLSGDPAAAAAHCARAVGDGGSPAGVLCEALRLVLMVRHSPVHPGPPEPAAAARNLDRLLSDDIAVPWLADVVRALGAVWGDPERLAEADTIAAIRRDVGDGWGALVASAAGAFGRWRLRAAGRRVDAEGALRRCGEDAATLGAGVVEVWARVALAVLARAAGAPDAGRLTAQARDLAAVVQVPAAAALLDGPPGHDGGPPGLPPAPERGAVTTAGGGLAGAGRGGVPQQPRPPVTRIDTRSRRPRCPARPERIGAAETPAVTVRCFGRFELANTGEPVLWATLRPKSRSLLRLLTVRDGRRVHVESLYEQLWPGLPPEAARRNLHVSISSIRRVLAPLAPTPGQSILRRDAETYLLVLPEQADYDLRRFTAALARWREVRASATPQAVAAILRQVLSAYTGELLPEEGPAEWIVEDRGFYRQSTVDAAAALATVQLATGQYPAAVEACRRGLQIDRLHDPSWRLLVEAYTRSGDLAAADRAAAGYQEVLAELGVSG